MARNSTPVNLHMYSLYFRPMTVVHWPFHGNTFGNFHSKVTLKPHPSLMEPAWKRLFDSSSNNKHRWFYLRTCFSVPCTSKDIIWAIQRSLLPPDRERPRPWPADMCHFAAQQHARKWMPLCLFLCSHTEVKGAKLFVWSTHGKGRTLLCSLRT